MDVFIGNLPSGATAAELERLFAGYAGYCRFAVREQRVNSGRTTWCAVGCVLPDVDALRAVRALNMQEYRGRPMMVMEYLGRKNEGAMPEPPAKGKVVAAARLFGRGRRVEPRQGDRRQGERRDGDRRGSERRVGDRRSRNLSPSEHPLGEACFNDHRKYQRRVGERRSGVERRSADRRREERRI